MATILTDTIVKSILALSNSLEVQKDHGNLEGLSGDDHPQYSLVDGTRAFTGQVSGLTGSHPTHFVTKEQLDNVGQNGADWQNSVLNMNVTSPPGGSPTEGDRYVVASVGATGVFSGQANNIAEYTQGAWVFTIPNKGFTLLNEAEGMNYTYNGSTWVNMGSTISHTALMGLSNDDHVQYSRVDGTRNYTGTVGGLDAVAATDFVTKQQQEALVGGLSWQEPCYSYNPFEEPSSPTQGDRYVLGPGPYSGAWTGKEGYIAEWNGVQWGFVAPTLGMTVFAGGYYYSYYFGQWYDMGKGISHSFLQGLNQDDHPQYHNDARGDARYPSSASFTSLSNIVNDHVSNISNPHGVTVAQIGAVPTTRTINTTAPLYGGGALSSDLTLNISVATTSSRGTMSSADKVKLNGIEAGADVTDVTNVTAAGAIMTSSPAGGSLTGTYPNPGIATGAIGGLQVAAAIKDPIVSTPGLRTLGTGPLQAAAGDHTHAFSALTSKPTTLAGYGITDAIPLAQKSAVNGVATLDAGGKVPIAQLPSHLLDTNLDAKYVNVTGDTMTGPLTATDITAAGGDIFIKGPVSGSDVRLWFQDVGGVPKGIVFYDSMNSRMTMRRYAENGSYKQVYISGTVFDVSNLTISNVYTPTAGHHAANKSYVDGLAAKAVTAGAGLTGGGDGTADRTINIGANVDGSITVNADDIQVGVLATDTQHGLRGGDTLHALATASAHGFMSSGDFSKLATIESGATGDQTASEILNALLTVDGSGSGLDADLLDGQHGAYYLNAASMNAGTINNARLPGRLQAYAQLITDWNDAFQNGWYRGNGALNAPGTGWYLGNVEAHGDAGWSVQTVHAFTADGPSDTKSYRRELNNGTWGSWYKILISEQEMDNRFVNVTGDTMTGTLVVNRGTGVADIFGDLLLQNGTFETRLHARLGANNYSSLPQADDAGLIFGGAQGFVLAPRSATAGGIRIDSAGKITLGTEANHIDISGDDANNVTTIEATNALHFAANDNTAPIPLNETGFLDLPSGVSSIVQGLTSHESRLDAIDVDLPSTYVPLAQKGAISGVAELDAGGKVPVSQLPATALPEVHVVADATVRAALTVQEGDEAIQLDDGTHWIYDGTTWYDRPVPTAPIFTVFGRVGAITAEAGDYTAAQVGAVPVARTVNTTAPLYGGGALSSDLTLNISVATTSNRGTMSAEDKTKLNGIEDGAEVNPDASEILAALKTVELDDRYVDVTGDTMTGNLTVPTPTLAGHAATKDYVDSKIAIGSISSWAAETLSQSNIIGSVSYTSCTQKVDGDYVTLTGTITLNPTTSGVVARVFITPPVLPTSAAMGTASAYEGIYHVGDVPTTAHCRISEGTILNPPGMLTVCVDSISDGTHHVGFSVTYPK